MAKKTMCHPKKKSAGGRGGKDGAVPFSCTCREVAWRDLPARMSPEKGGVGPRKEIAGMGCGFLFGG